MRPVKSTPQALLRCKRIILSREKYRPAQSIVICKRTGQTDQTARALAVYIEVSTLNACWSPICYLFKSLNLAMIEDYKHLLKKMNHNEAFTFYNEYNLRSRQPSVGISLALLFGWLGAHRFWLEDKKGGFTFLVFFWTLLPALFSIFDALCMSELCKQHNNKLAKKLFDDIKELSPYQEEKAES